MRSWVRNSGSRCSDFEQASNFGPTGSGNGRKISWVKGLIDVLASFARGSQGSLKVEKH